MILHSSSSSNTNSKEILGSIFTPSSPPFQLAISACVYSARKFIFHFNYWLSFQRLWCSLNIHRQMSHKECLHAKVLFCIKQNEITTAVCTDSCDRPRWMHKMFPVHSSPCRLENTAWMSSAFSRTSSEDGLTAVELCELDNDLLIRLELYSSALIAAYLWVACCSNQLIIIQGSHILQIPWLFQVYKIPWQFQVFHVYQVCGNPVIETEELDGGLWSPSIDVDGLLWPCLLICRN